MEFECPKCAAQFADMEPAPKNIECPSCQHLFVPVDKNAFKINETKKSLAEVFALLKGNTQLQFLIDNFPQDVYSERGFRGIENEIHDIIIDKTNDKIISTLLKVFSIAGDWCFVKEIFQYRFEELNEDDLLNCFEMIKLRIYNGGEPSYPYAGGHGGDYYESISILLQKWNNPILFNYLVSIIENESNIERHGCWSLLENILIIFDEKNKSIIRFNNSKSIVDVLKKNISKRAFESNYRKEHALHIINDW